ncbi:helix-turn-helix domain-containing protein [Streptococcus ruminantium]|uniref:Helix-turn-helix transcriptional regulator n=1 Tax=Streptococcus ruminantium TaxID=1917441 RepID=A0ABU1B6C2_9STRE|nr:helix-turn-helix transcriptional regulator [Streptococcus ruminantium]MDQ8759074.1 helix-turn-helix transcriptional regulator [Streptococcus ruminantium]MDQ8769990.1 helix-turn-helix transcriptional regulator [Streptococcus ruminantium]MDQ8775497.1 helix-turn-helix transcriptional regulator [Streptococcus ruminantium]MDQ8794435.1 helix-turn-helix transcriptional regulator [Streptococcus ruminantium]MDQ8796670.1 helix-turn-helix transcriptional regulator [Streptococcus ruminantium]
MFTERLKQLRKEKGLTQKELAQLLNISQPAYAQWERNIKNPTQENLSQLAQILDTSTDYLLGNTSIKNFQDLDIETVKDSLRYSLGFNGNLNIPEEEIQSMAEAFLEHFSNRK